MDCLVLPIVRWRRRSAGARLGYLPLSSDGHDDGGGFNGPVTVVVGKEKREFLVDPFVLEEDPFKYLINMVTVTVTTQEEEEDNKQTKAKAKAKAKQVIFVDVDAILFEHMLWLMYNDFSSLFNLNLKEIIDFYAQDT